MSPPPGLVLPNPVTTPSNMTGGIDFDLLKEVPPSQAKISSTDRRVIRPSPGEASPVLSAMGRHRPTAAPTLRRAVPVPHSPSLAQSATTTACSSVTTHMSVTDPTTGYVSCVAHATWAGGRECERNSPLLSADSRAFTVNITSSLSRNQAQIPRPIAASFDQAQTRYRLHYPR
ncbi:hypothetical protein V8E53_015140 [Lactarius tabidus]